MTALSQSGFQIERGVFSADEIGELLSEADLGETSAGNGALKVIPGRHQPGKIPAESIRAHAEDSHVVCECEPGDVLLTSPLLLHASSRSVTPSRWRIVHIEYAPTLVLEKGLTWHEAAAATSLTIH